MLKALGDKTRLRIMQLLHEGERSVGEIVDLLEFSQANISKHLRVLYREGLLACRKEGTTVYYFISDPYVKRICSVICEGHLKLSGKK